MVVDCLKRLHAITYRRGVLRVLDRGRLEAAGCECYLAVRDDYDRNLGRSAA